jgi:hypothetical protein
VPAGWEVAGRVEVVVEPSRTVVGTGAGGLEVDWLGLLGGLGLWKLVSELHVV